MVAVISCVAVINTLVVFYVGTVAEKYFCDAGEIITGEGHKLFQKDLSGIIVVDILFKQVGLSVYGTGIIHINAAVLGKDTVIYIFQAKPFHL